MNDTMMGKILRFVRRQDVCSPTIATELHLDKDDEESKTLMGGVINLVAMAVFAYFVFVGMTKMVYREETYFSSLEFSVTDD